MFAERGTDGDTVRVLREREIFFVEATQEPEWLVVWSTPGGRMGYLRSEPGAMVPLRPLYWSASDAAEDEHLVLLDALCARPAEEVRVTVGRAVVAHARGSTDAATRAGLLATLVSSLPPEGAPYDCREAVRLLMLFTPAFGAR